MGCSVNYPEFTPEAWTPEGVMSVPAQMAEVRQHIERLLTKTDDVTLLVHWNRDPDTLVRGRYITVSGNKIVSLTETSVETGGPPERGGDWYLAHVANISDNEWLRRHDKQGRPLPAI